MSLSVHQAAMPDNVVDFPANYRGGDICIACGRSTALHRNEFTDWIGCEGAMRRSVSAEKRTSQEGRLNVLTDLIAVINIEDEHGAVLSLPCDGAVRKAYRQVAEEARGRASGIKCGIALHQAQITGEYLHELLLHALEQPEATEDVRRRLVHAFVAQVIAVERHSVRALPGEPQHALYEEAVEAMEIEDHGTA